jgi:hypothetical protein
MIITELRKFKVFGFSIVDFIGSYLVVFLLVELFKAKHNIKYYQLVVPVAIITHILTGTDTQLTRMVTNNEINIAKILLALNLTSLIFF